MRIAAPLIFFISGFSALVYQVTWQRMLVIFSGADVYSATVVIAAFMAGLGCGTIAGGHLADRVSRSRSLALFAAAEAGVAIFGFFSTFLLYEVLHERLGHLAAHPAVAALLLFIGLLWPTCLMGASLPLLARAIVRGTETAATTIGWLYAANTLGAAIGALSATWMLLPHQGMEGAVRYAAFLNLLCAIAAIPLAMIMFRGAVRTPDPGTDATAVQTPSTVEWSGTVSLRQWAALYALAGFIALSFEIVWFRMLGVMLKSTAVTFGTLLAQYLFWLGLGSAVGSVLARRSRRSSAAVFLTSQTAAALYAGIVLMVMVRVLPNAGSLRELHDYFASYEPLSAAEAAAGLQTFFAALRAGAVSVDTAPDTFLKLYLALPAIVIGPATFLMGLSFPFLQRVVQTDLAYLGRRVGALLVANIVGSTVGTVVTGWLLLATFGTAGTLRLLVVLSSVFAFRAAAALGRGRRSLLGYAAVVALISTAALSMPRGSDLWATLHGSTTRSVLAAEDGSGVSVLKAKGGDFAHGATVFVNGLGQSSFPYGDIHTALGALPAFIHPAPRDAAVIGLGSGDTLYAVSGRPELERIVSIEIIKPQMQTLRALVPLYPYPALVGLLEDPRIEHVFADGRAYLRNAGRTFDILEADALRPTSAYAGNLYSDAYFRLLRDRLKPGGLAVTWRPTDRIEWTFLRVFPHAVRAGQILIGSNQPIVVDSDAIAARLRDPGVQAHYRTAGIDINELVTTRLANPTHLVGGVDGEPQRLDINTDLHPRDELEIPRLFD